MNVRGVINRVPSMHSEERQTVRARALEWLEDGTEQQKREAKEVLDALAAAEAREQEVLVRHVAGLSKAERIVEAFQKLPMSESQRTVVQVLLDNPGLSSEALTKKAGWKAQAWHLRFGLMCRGRGHLLWPAPFDKDRGADFYSGILSDFDEATRGFTLKDEAVEAFERLGLRPSEAI
jgi:uncharacterized protein (DUF1778 family)